MSIASIAAQAPAQVQAPPPAQQAAPPQAPAPIKVQLQNAPAGAAQDTVIISSAARALQEATETSAQTAREASHGDRQAQRKLTAEEARQAAH